MPKDVTGLQKMYKQYETCFDLGSITFVLITLSKFKNMLLKPNKRAYKQAKFKKNYWMPKNVTGL